MEEETSLKKKQQTRKIFKAAAVLSATYLHSGCIHNSANVPARHQIPAKKKKTNVYNSGMEFEKTQQNQ